MMLFEPKRDNINLQFRSSLSAPTAYIRFIRFFLLIVILCDISPIYSAIVNHSSWLFIVYKVLMVVLLSISFVGFINDKWTGPVYFCVALSTSCLVYASEIVISYLNEQPQTAKALALILGLELIVLWASWRYFRKRRLLFQPDCPYLHWRSRRRSPRRRSLLPMCGPNAPLIPLDRNAGRHGPPLRQKPRRAAQQSRQMGQKRLRRRITGKNETDLHR